MHEHSTPLLDGRKTVESCFARVHCGPWQQIAAGDLIVLKRSSGPVVGIFEAGHVEFLHLHPAALTLLR